jgi:phosphoglycolate phosphatase
VTALATLLARYPEHNPQALLFDLDGTLVDSVPDLAVAVDGCLKELGLAAAGEPRVRQWVGNGARLLMQRALAHALELSEEQLKTGQIDRALRLFLQHYQHSNGSASKVYPTVIESLSHWQQQQRPMAVVTNKPLQFVPELLAKMSLDGFFQVLVGGDCTTNKKPSPQPLHYACQLLKQEPRHCLMVGDSRNDVLAAQAAEMPVVAVNYGYNHGEAIELSQPDCVVSSFAEIHLPK